MNYPAFYKTEKKGEVINLAMVTQMYKRDDMCIVELVSGSACVITEKEMEQIYHSFKVWVNIIKGGKYMKAYTLVGVDGNAFAIMGYVRSAMKSAKMTSQDIDAYTHIQRMLQVLITITFW